MKRVVLLMRTTRALAISKVLRVPGNQDPDGSRHLGGAHFSHRENEGTEIVAISSNFKY